MSGRSYTPARKDRMPGTPIRRNGRLGRAEEREAHLLAEQLGIDLEDYEGEGDHLAAGGVVRARYKTIDVRLHAPDAEQDGYREWRSRIGFVENCWYSNGLVVLGGVGFFDQFEVAIGGPSQAVAISVRAGCPGVRDGRRVERG